MTHEQPMYSESWPLAMWARVLAWGATAGVGFLMILNPPEGSSPPVRWAFALGLSALGFVFERVLGGITVDVHATHVQLYLGRRGPIRKRVPLTRVVRVEPVRYRPLREFGGWGLRGFGKRQAWTARGDQAVVLHLDDGTELFIGSDHPQRLAERIEHARSGVARPSDPSSQDR